MGTTTHDHLRSLSSDIDALKSRVSEAIDELFHFQRYPLDHCAADVLGLQREVERWVKDILESPALCSPLMIAAFCAKLRTFTCEHIERQIGSDWSHEFDKVLFDASHPALDAFDEEVRFSDEERPLGQSH